MTADLIEQMTPSPTPDVAGTVAELRAVADRIGANWAFEPLRRAADLLEQQAKALSEAEVHIKRLTSNPADHRYWEGRYRDEAARLSEAMKVIEPFAAIAEHDIGSDEADADNFSPMSKYNRAPRLTVGHLRAARAFVNAQKESSDAS